MDSWTSLCRCCLSPESEVSLLDDVNKVREKFLEITTIEVFSDDCLPQKLCKDCYNIMNAAYQFRRQCIKMDTELKIQLDAINKEEQEATEDLKSLSSEIDFANDPMKQLEAIIKSEPPEPDASDDDFYYVLVIDDKDKEGESEETSDTPIKPPKTEMKKEPIDFTEFTKDTSENQTDDSSYPYEFILNDKVPINVPATILENEEESQENEDNYDDGMDVDMDHNTQDSTSQDRNLNHMEDSQDNIEVILGNSEGEYALGADNNSIIKILSAAGSDGTLLLKGEDGIQYLTTNSQLIATNEHGEPLNQEDVIFCEGDESSQFQILKCDGSELVIEYADGDQIATVLQQEDGSFLCECGKQFADLGEYEKHQFTHNPAGEHLCTLCGKGFETEEILAGHMLLHSNTGAVVQCPYCDQVVKRNALTQHIKYGHNNSKPECNLCWKTFANPNNLKRHMMIHSGVREFECDICQKRFNQKITMQTHRLTHIDPFACKECDRTFDSKSTLTLHKATNECNKSKVKKVKAELMKTVKQEITTNLGKLLGYACSLCKKMFSLESALEQHVESTHMIDPSDLLCPECGEVLPSKKDMQTHIMTHKNYKAKNAKRFECNDCGKNCSSQAMLIMHERVHTNERPFPCALCSLRFKTKTHLRTHQLTHTREKKFGCSVCMKFFALKGNLVVHLRTHTGERPYVCSICSEAFIDSKYLKKHKLKKHAIENVPWNQY